MAGELRASGALFAVAAVCWLAGQLLLGVAAHRRGLALRLRVLPIFAAALWPPSFLLLPDNYGLNGTLSDVMPFLGSLLVGSVLLGNAAAGGRSPLTGAGTAVVGMAGRLAGGRGEGAA